MFTEPAEEGICDSRSVQAGQTQRHPGFGTGVSRAKIRLALLPTLAADAPDFSQAQITFYRVGSFGLTNLC